MNKTSQKSGFVQIVLLAIIVIGALAYFNIDLRTIFANPNIQKITHIFVVAWDTYIKPLFLFLYTSFSALFTK